VVGADDDDAAVSALRAGGDVASLRTGTLADGVLELVPVDDLAGAETRCSRCCSRPLAPVSVSVVVSASLDASDAVSADLPVLVSRGTESAPASDALRASDWSSSASVPCTIKICSRVSPRSLSLNISCSLTGGGVSGTSVAAAPASGGSADEDGGELPEVADDAGR
jgi:hypothetical protein